MLLILILLPILGGIYPSPPSLPSSPFPLFLPLPIPPFLLSSSTLSSLSSFPSLLALSLHFQLLVVSVFPSLPFPLHFPYSSNFWWYLSSLILSFSFPFPFPPPFSLLSCSFPLSSLPICFLLSLSFPFLSPFPFLFPFN